MSKKQYNVNREVNDAFYRYKMPGIVAKVEGQGNGIKTVIVNMVDIARALNREPVFPTKYFGMELGAQTQIDEKNDRFIVNGSHDADKLQDILDGYIKKFVLCSKCDNPETTLTVKREDIVELCKACGNKGKIRSMGHSLSNFIVRQHKNKKILEGKNKKDKKDIKSTTKDIYKGEGTDDIAVKIVKIAAAKDEWDGEEWADSDSEDEVTSMKNLNLMDMKPSNMSSAQKGEAFEMYIQKLVDDGTLPEMMKVREKITQIVLKSEYYGLKMKAPFVFFEKMLTTEDFTKIKMYRPLFVLINRNSDETSDLKAMKYCISALEVYVEKFGLSDKIGVFLKYMYDSDILDEEAIIEWGSSKPSKKYISKELSAELKEKSKKLVEWLKTADIESDEDSDDDIEITDHKVAGIHEEEKKPVVEIEEEDDGEDVDIEDI